MSAAANPDRRRDANRLLAIVATAAALALHFYLLGHAGGLWRDEVNSLNLAQGELNDVAHDAFPALFPLLLRGWSAMGLAQSDLSVRCLGVLIGLGLPGAFWLAARWTRRAPPLWSLALVALNAWVIYYAASLRAYGLGSALIALCAAAAWRFAENPGRKNWLLFAAAAVLSVQALYQNSMLVAGVCAGASAVALRRKNFKLTVAIFLAGLTAAVSLLPYFHAIAGAADGASPLRMPFDRVIALNDLDTLLAYPLPQYVWVWIALTAVVAFRAAAGFFSPSGDDRPLFAFVTLAAGAAAFWVFLRLADFPLQPWYFLPPVAVAAVCLDAALPPPAGKFRAPLFGGLAATVAVSALFALRILNCRFTDVDLAAKRVAALAGKNDFAVVAPWQAGITFARYFDGRCDWTTLPPMADHRIHRYDLLRAQMQDTNALRPLLERVAATLRAGGAVWLVRDIGVVAGTNAPAAPAALPPPPLPASGWNETPYRFNWNRQLGWLMRRATNVENLKLSAAADAGFNEEVRLSKATGWKD